MEVTINYNESYQHGKYIVLNVTLHNDSENTVSCVFSLSGGEIREHETRKVVQAQRSFGACTLPYTIDGVDHSFGVVPVELSADETITDNLVFLITNEFNLRELTITDLNANNTEIYRCPISDLEKK